MLVFGDGGLSLVFGDVCFFFFKKGATLEHFSFQTTTEMFYPKDPWTLQWRGWNLYSRGPGSQNRHF